MFINRKSFPEKLSKLAALVLAFNTVKYFIYFSVYVVNQSKTGSVIDETLTNDIQ